MPLQIRRGTEAERQAMTIPLAVGEPLFVTDTGSIWVGDGISPGGIQVTGLTIEDSVDAVAAALVAGVNQNITFIYGSTQDQADRIDCRIDLSSVEGVISSDGFKGSVLADDSGVIINSSNRNISANEIAANNINSDNIIVSGSIISSSVVSDFKGSVSGDDSTILVDALNSTFNLDQTIKTDVVPAFSDTISLGSTVNNFRRLYLGSQGLFIDGAQIRSSLLGAIELPEGSTIGGQPISVLGNLTGDINANIIGDDSSVIVNVSTNQITADLFTGDLIGDVRGSVFGSDSTRIIDGTSNTLRTTNLTLADNTISSDLSIIQVGDILDDQKVQIYSGNQSFLELTGVYDPIAQEEPWIDIRVSAGTMDSPIAASNGDVLSGMMIFGYDGTQFLRSVTIGARVSGTVATGVVPGEFIVAAESDTPDEGSILSFKGNQGVLSSPVIKPGVYANATARDTFITAPEEGMMIFNQALQKFQGYVSDVGIAGGGAPTTTPGWVDLN